MVKAKTKAGTKSNRTGAKRGAASAKARVMRWVSDDEALSASARSACEALGGWSFEPLTVARLGKAKPATNQDVLVLDGALGDANVYELCRGLVGQTGCRVYIATDAEPKLADGIARFCGAAGVLPRRLTAASLRRTLGVEEPRPALPAAGRAKSARKLVFPKAKMRDVAGAVDKGLVAAISDPETNLFNYAFLHYKLDEEFKRAQRFGQPLSCVLVGLDGECSAQTLRELAGIFLSASRDTDVLGRFDLTSFLFFLPSTGPDGARIMAERVVEQARRLGLRDLVGDPLGLAVGIASMPSSKMAQRDDLFAAARRAFLAAQRKGGGVEVA